MADTVLASADPPDHEAGWGDDGVYALALAAGGGDADAGRRPWLARYADGRAVVLDPALRRWCGRLDPVDRALLTRCTGPVLDVGCGPGRLVAGLLAAGQHATGLDTSAAAVALARGAGVPVLHRSVFDRLPGQGRWATVLLADGNIGIGGDPVRLLRRCRELVSGDGRVLVETDPPQTQMTLTSVRLESGPHVSRWLPWAHVGADDVRLAAADARLRTGERWSQRDRWFAELRP